MMAPMSILLSQRVEKSQHRGRGRGKHQQKSDQLEKHRGIKWGRSPIRRSIGKEHPAFKTFKKGISWLPLMWEFVFAFNKFPHFY